jgi:beta-phosphoglucomutase-like phosphatase (HAD superfamily)
LKLLNAVRPPNTVRADRVQAVVFDWAGTTVDFGSVAPARTLQRLFADCSITLTEPETRRDMGLPKKEHIRAILALPRICDAWKDPRGRAPNDSDVDELYAQFIPMQLSCLAEHSAIIHAGCWSVGVAGTGNGIGLSFAQFQQLSSSERETRLADARAELRHAGAHYLIDSVRDVLSVLDNINACLQQAR